MGYQENGQNIIGFRETRVLRVIFMKIMKIHVALGFWKKHGFFTKIFQIRGFASVLLMGYQENSQKGHPKSSNRNENLYFS